MSEPSAPTSGPNRLLREHLGEVLRARRLAQRLTQVEVAARAGISAQYLSEIERGIKDPSSEVVEAAAEAVGTSLRELLIVVVTALPTPVTELLPVAAQPGRLNHPGLADSPAEQGARVLSSAGEMHCQHSTDGGLRRGLSSVGTLSARRSPSLRLRVA